MASEDEIESIFDLTIEDLQDIVKSGDMKIIEFGGIDGICRKLKTSLTTGLCESPGQLEQRRKIYGSNGIPMKKGKSFLVLVWEALQDVTLIILIISAAISIGLTFYQPYEENADAFETEEVGSSWIEGLAIIITVVIVVLITSLNDWEKERRYRSLQKRIEGQNKFAVLRNSEPQTILSSDIVVGDICHLKYGDKIPADGVFAQGNDLMVDESSMTGESEAMKKDAKNPILLSGTNVMEGSGKMIVVATGLNSQVGIISVLLGTAEPQDKNAKKDKKNTQDKETAIVAKLPENMKSDKKESSVLKVKLTKLAIQIGYAGLVIAILTMVILIIRFCITKYIVEDRGWEVHHPQYFVQCAIIGITILVVAIPEGLPLAVTLALVYSVKKMTKDNNLVRHLDACETMGNATVICSDKTGTLTTNRMTVVTSYICGEVYTEPPGFYYIPSTVAYALVEGICVNTSYSSNMLPPLVPNGLPFHIGNRTECALLGFVEDLGVNYELLRNRHPESSFIKVYTFNSVRKSMSTVIRKRGGGYRLYTKGASEIILAKCSFIHNNRGEVQHMTTQIRNNLLEDVIEVMASNSLRTICTAYKDFVPIRSNINQEVSVDEPNWDDEQRIVNNLTLLCIVGIEDPVRPEVPEAIRKCQSAGISVCMITGDNINTARSIALKCGILTQADLKVEGSVLEGAEFNRRIHDSSGQFQQHLLDAVWPKLKVLARSSPSDKHTLVKGIIDSRINVHREVVAATGDGTNDGPALRVADVGFAMGIAGTDVAKDASDIILTDDNFNSIVAAVLWGRNVYDSICKFLKFQLTVNIVAVTCALISACAIEKVPISAIQMLWVNLIMDSLASLALATEPPTDDLLLRKPYGRTRSLISKNMLKNIIGHSVYQLIILFLFLFGGHVILDVPEGTHNEPSQHFTFVFNSFVMMTLCNEINARKLHGEKNVFKGMFSNPFFCTILFGSLIAQAIIVQFGGHVLYTKGLDEEQWLWCIFCGISTIIYGQILNSFKKLPFQKSKVNVGDNEAKSKSTEETV